MQPLKTIEEIRALIKKANLSPDDAGRPVPSNAVDELNIVTGADCGQPGGHFIGIHNTNRNRRIHAYYLITSNAGGPWQGDDRIGPGQTLWVVCSHPAPSQYMGLYITGAYYE